MGEYANDLVHCNAAKIAEKREYILDSGFIKAKLAGMGDKKKPSVHDIFQMEKWQAVKYIKRSMFVHSQTRRRNDAFVELMAVYIDNFRDNAPAGKHAEAQDVCEHICSSFASFIESGELLALGLGGHCFLKSRLKY